VIKYLFTARSMPSAPAGTVPVDFPNVNASGHFFVDIDLSLNYTKKFYRGLKTIGLLAPSLWARGIFQVRQQNIVAESGF